jgi:hypothetical protein
MIKKFPPQNNDTAILIGIPSNLLILELSSKLRKTRSNSKEVLMLDMR